MASQHKIDIATVDHTLGQAAAQFLLRLPPENRSTAQQEVYKFVRWYGEDRRLSELTIPEVESYTNQITSSVTEVAEKLAVVKNLLTYCHKQKLTTTNLAVHIKLQKAPSKPITHSRRQHRRVISLTEQGFSSLQAELAALKDERPRIAEELKKAAADKDFRENAPLDSAREQQAYIEGRIKELEEIIKTATVAGDEQTESHEISIGDTVVLIEAASEEEARYTLVDTREANPIEGKISAASPMGQALLGRTKGEKIAVRAPAGILNYEIKDIRHK